MKSEKELSDYFFKKSLEQELVQSDHAKLVQSVLNELGLNENARFKAFVSDLAVNTANLSAKPKENMQEKIKFEMSDGAEFERMRLQLPVLDRFINLMVTIKDPQAI